MSYSVDVNLLLYASDEASPHHEAASTFLSQCASGPEILGLAWITALSYLRIATDPKIFNRPLSARQAERNIAQLIQLPQVRMLHETESFWAHYQGCAQTTPLRGNLVPDAHLACILRANGVKVLYTNDSDFRKFEFIEPRSYLG